MKIAFFISDHGFGHAGRAAAVIQQITTLNKDAEVTVFTSVAKQFFTTTPGIDPNYIKVWTDVGLIQKDFHTKDLDKTLHKLNEFLAHTNHVIPQLSRYLTENKFDLVYCDISTLGIEVAKHANLPSILVENFRWDWIYEPFIDTYPQIMEYIKYFKDIYSQADYHVQVAPICDPVLEPSLKASIVARKPFQDRNKIRKDLGVGADEPLVLLTTGGFHTSKQSSLVDGLSNIRDKRFVFYGDFQKIEKVGNLILIPHVSIYMPDMINAVDLCITKLGVSTVAELSTIGIPYIYVGNKDFREEEVLKNYSKKNAKSLEISYFDFIHTNFLEPVNVLLQKQTRICAKNSASEVAQFVLSVANFH